MTNRVRKIELQPSAPIRTLPRPSGFKAVSGTSRSEEIALAGLTATFPHIEMLPNGEILVVAPRCERFQDGGHELNAQVYDRTGTLRREFLLGDGIEHVQADARGNI